MILGIQFSMSIIQLVPLLLNVIFLFQRFHFPLSVSVTHYTVVFILASMTRFYWELKTGKKRIILSWSDYLKRVLPTGNKEIIYLFLFWGHKTLVRFDHNLQSTIAAKMGWQFFYMGCFVTLLSAFWLLPILAPPPQTPPSPTNVVQTTIIILFCSYNIVQGGGRICEFQISLVNWRKCLRSGCGIENSQQFWPWLLVYIYDSFWLWSLHYVCSPLEIY